MELTYSGPWMDQLTQLALLEPGWNGYSAPVPDAKALAAVRRFLAILQDEGEEPTRLAASAVGGIGVTRRQGDRKVYVEFLNNGLVHALFADDADLQMDTRTIQPTDEGYRNLITAIRYHTE